MRKGGGRGRTQPTEVTKGAMLHEVQHWSLCEETKEFREQLDSELASHLWGIPLHRLSSCTVNP